jgi:hypothetical protein
MRSGALFPKFFANAGSSYVEAFAEAMSFWEADWQNATRIKDMSFGASEFREKRLEFIQRISEEIFPRGMCDVGVVGGH